MKEMVITIDTKGNITVDTKGFTGIDCVKETKKLEEELGLIENRNRKPEYYKKAKITNFMKVSR